MALPLTKIRDLEAVSNALAAGECLPVTLDGDGSYLAHLPVALLFSALLNQLRDNAQWNQSGRPFGDAEVVTLTDHRVADVMAELKKAEGAAKANDLGVFIEHLFRARMVLERNSATYNCFTGDMRDIAVGILIRRILKTATNVALTQATALQKAQPACLLSGLLATPVGDSAVGNTCP